jgi:aspartyl-tRNA(Asn)/glutamyl-tRNA(Gln) amidotransferase subunit A
VRIPCCFTGLVGIKAQFGRVPVWPTSATPTLAHVGPIARNVGDAALLLMAVGGYDPRDPFSVSAAMPDLLGACRAGVRDLRIAYSTTLGYARPDPDVAAIVASAARTCEDLGCKVELVEKIFDEDPADLWTAEFYAGVGTRLRPFVENQRDLLDPAVAEVLDAALSQEMRDYYEKVFERYAFRDKVRAAPRRSCGQHFLRNLRSSAVAGPAGLVSRRRQKHARSFDRPYLSVLGVLHLPV